MFYPQTGLDHHWINGVLLSPKAYPKEMSHQQNALGRMEIQAPDVWRILIVNFYARFSLAAKSRWKMLGAELCAAIISLTRK
jgi:hypothetical protein